MRILFLTSNAFIPDHFSGQNRTLQELCQKLQKQGHEPIILAGRPSAHGQSDILVDRTYGFKLFRSTRPIESVQPLAVSLRPDIIVVVDGYIEGLIEQCKALDFPVAAWFFHVEPSYYRNSLLDRELLYLASSPFLAARIRGLFGVEAKVVFPYIEQKRYRKNRNGQRILFVNPVREKGVEIAFDLAGQRPDLAFTFIESWGISESWRATCFERALRCGNLEWLPPMDDISSILDKTRVLLVPRYTEEGFCRTITEVQLSGIPVLAADRGYLADNVGQGGTMLNIDAGGQAWLKQLDRYFEDEDFYQRKREKARNHAEREELDRKQVVDRLLKLLTGHVAQHSQNRPARLRR